MSNTEIIEELVERLSSAWPELAEVYEEMSENPGETTQDSVYVFVVRRCIEIGSVAQTPDRAYKKLLTSLRQAAADIQELAGLAG